MQRMKRSGSKLLCILLLLSLLLSLTACGKPETQLEKTAGYLQAQIAEPGTASVGGDWQIFGLDRSGVKVPQKYFDSYYENVAAAVREKNGVLSDRKYTEYSRTVLALTALGKNPADVAGFDLLKPLADFEQGTRQGINGTSFALLALVGSVKYLPFASRSGVNAMLQLSGEIEEAALITGVPWWKRMVRVIFPIQKSSFLSGYLLPMVSCMRELSLFVLLVPTSNTILTTMLMQYSEKGWAQFGTAINLLIIVVVLLVNLTVNKLTGASIDKGVGG